MNAITPLLTPLAVQNASLLRALMDGPHPSIAALAKSLGRDTENVRKSIKSLAAAGLVGADNDLLPEGRSMVEALNRADNLAPAGATQDATEIPLALIDCWPLNPRTQFDPVGDEEMALSIADKGVLQPIMVRPKGDRYEVVIGEKRRRGATLAQQRGYVDASFAMPCRVRTLTDHEALEIAGVENLQREDMHWMDEAKWYLALASRLSGSQIERLVGGTRKKRSIQDYIKCARELTPEQIAQTYLPPDAPGYLSYVKARDLTGEKKERPALDLSPKLAVALLEIIDAGLRQTSTFADRPNQVVVTHYHKAPVGGPLMTLSTERKLTTFGFDQRKVVSRTTLTAEVLRWLEQQHYNPDPSGALYKARAAVVGDLHASRLQADSEYLTPELNAPASAAPAPQPVTETPPVAPPLGLPGLGQSDDDDFDDGDDETPDPTVHNVDGPDEALSPSQRRVLREIAARSIHRTRLPDDYVKADDAALCDPDFIALYDRNFVTKTVRSADLMVALTLAGRDYLKRQGLMPEAKSANSCSTPWLRSDQGHDDGPSAAPAPSPLGRQDEGEIPGYLSRLAGAAGAAPTAAPQAPADKPTLPPMLAIVVVEVAHRISDAGVERGPGTWGVPILADFYKDNRGTQLVQQHKMLAFMAHGEKTMVVLTKAGREWLADTCGVMFDQERPIVGPDLLRDQQISLTGVRPERLYSTPWLNPAAEPEASAPEEPPTPAPRQPTDFERRVIALDSAARQMAEYLQRLPSRSKAPKADEVATYLQLVESAREGIRPHLPAEA